jgi:hypothetical protein
MNPGVAKNVSVRSDVSIADKGTRVEDPVICICIQEMIG